MSYTWNQISPYNLILNNHKHKFANRGLAIRVKYKTSIYTPYFRIEPDKYPYREGRSLRSSYREGRSLRSSYQVKLEPPLQWFWEDSQIRQPINNMIETDSAAPVEEIRLIIILPPGKTLIQTLKITKPEFKIYDHIYVINRSNDLLKRHHIMQQLGQYQLKYSFFPAINGYLNPHLTQYQNYKHQKNSHELQNKYHRYMIPSPGAYGYLKSWKNLLLDAKANDYQTIISFDDDVYLCHNFTDQLNQAIEKIPSDWQILYLGATQHGWAKIKLEDGYYQPNLTDGSFAVILKSSVFDVLLQKINQMNIAFDSGPLRDITALTPSYVCYPNLVMPDVTKSQINEPRNQEELAAKVRWNIKSFPYPSPIPTISIIMPVYNAEKTLALSIKSLLRQTYPNLQIIIINDGSTDQTAKIIKKYQKKDPRIVSYTFCLCLSVSLSVCVSLSMCVSLSLCVSV